MAIIQIYFKISNFDGRNILFNVIVSSRSNVTMPFTCKFFVSVADDGESPLHSESRVTASPEVRSRRYGWSGYID